jgi:bile acid:Na+ symporter, BASS family
MTLQQSVILALQASILMTVFAFGLRATFSDVAYVVRHPSLLVRSLLALLVIMPIIAIALTEAFAFRPSVEIVLIALAISPIPPILPGKEEKAGGHTSFALGIMAIAGLVSVVTVPAAVRLIGRYFAQPFAMSSGAIAKIVLTSIVLPLAAGLLFRSIWPAVAARIVKPLALVATVMLVAGFLVIFAAAFRDVLALIGNGTILALAAFAAAGFAIGHWLGGPDREDRVALAFSTACRHPAIAMAVATANFPNERYLGATIILYLLVSAAVGILYRASQQRRPAATTPQAV